MPEINMLTGIYKKGFALYSFPFMTAAWRMDFYVTHSLKLYQSLRMIDEVAILSDSSCLLAVIQSLVAMHIFLSSMFLSI